MQKTELDPYSFQFGDNIFNAFGNYANFSKTNI